ncbi:hypothetical protein [Achromobacter sp. NFACC18-2]|uniref:hypothetical protein n=1 Tax=Achromobacter sp. NFACC18-2 TaxID=1564112 RepID=UPI0008BD8C44|nr:hypothetical protein [Achromobacter sp. NFACC18-2]SEJ90779.1 hypothetical protein SAMN03159494_03823 [Achromobacter sp. NFACC18-2]
MAILGKAAIAMWWDMSPGWRAEFEDWHSHEHFPERMGIPGFLRGSRWTSAHGGEGFFVMYELDAYATLVSPGYLDRLNAPTPWSTKLMPQHRNMIRSQCRVLESVGGGLARYALTLRLSPRAGSEDALHAYLKAHAAAAAARPGLTGAHLLVTDTPRMAATAEQQIRGGKDRAADWIYIVNGYAINAVTACDGEILNSAQMRAFTGEAPAWSEVYCLSHTLEAARAT